MDLRHGEVRVRRLRVSDARPLKALRDRNEEWLRPWEATVPPGAPPPPGSYRAMVRDLGRQAREGRSLPCAVDVGAVLVGQLNVSNIIGGSAQFGSVGYWVDRAYAGRGVTPTAVALVVDFCFTRIGLHRIEVAIRPENSSSLRVVEKLGLAEVGFAPRYLHIAGEWRDHRLFAITAEDVPGGLLRRYLAGRPRA